MKGWVNKLVIAAVAIVGGWWGLRALGFDVFRISPEHVRDFVLSFGVWAPLIYLLSYGQPFVPLPASIMTLTGGLVFGPFWGTLGALAGATLRACAEFGVARLMGRDAVAKLLKGRIARFDQTIGEHTFKTVLLIRMIPNLPFDMQNYGLGFSRARFWPFALATPLGMAPACFGLVYLGHSMTDPTQVWKLALGIGLIVVSVAVPTLWGRRHRRLLGLKNRVE